MASNYQHSNLTFNPHFIPNGQFVNGYGSYDPLFPPQPPEMTYPSYQQPPISEPAPMSPYHNQYINPALPLSQRITAVKRGLEKIPSYKQKFKEVAAEAKARRHSKWNNIGWLIISPKFYTHSELDLARDKLLPLCQELEMMNNSIAEQIESIKTDFPEQGGLELKAWSFAVWSIRTGVDLEMWNYKRVQRKGKEVIEERERKGRQSVAL